MNESQSRRSLGEGGGFTLIESLIVFAILAIILGGSVAMTGKFSSDNKIYYEALRIKSNLNEQYSKAVQGTAFGEDSPLKFGVCFSPSGYSLFATTSVWSERIDTYTQKFELQASMEFEDFNFYGECEGRQHASLIFFPITGAIEAPGSVVAKDNETEYEYLISVGQGGLTELTKQ